MKQILDLKDVKFKWWQWHSDWIDVAVYEFGVDAFLLQMRIGRTNGKQFRDTRISREKVLQKGALVHLNDKGHV